MTSMKYFCNEHHVKCDPVMVGENPHMDTDPAWQGYHYKVTLKAQWELDDGRHTTRQMTTYFSMGIGLDREPTAADVLDCLASDAASVENAQSFEDWCGDFGYDTDSRRAERTFKIIENQAMRLKKFLGEHGYKTLLWDTERL